MKTTHTGKKLAAATGLTGLAIAGLAGVYFLYGKDGAKNRKKVMSWALKAKADILEKFEKAKDMTESDYHAIIDTVSAKYAKYASNEDVQALGKELKKHWKDIHKELTPIVKEAKKKAKKMSEKASKSAK